GGDAGDGGEASVSQIRGSDAAAFVTGGNGGSASGGGASGSGGNAPLVDAFDPFAAFVRGLTVRGGDAGDVDSATAELGAAGNATSSLTQDGLFTPMRAGSRGR